MKDYNLTPAQREAIKRVEQALRAAGNLGVHFWDNCGRMTAYNAKAINLPAPDRAGEPLNDDFIQELNVKNFHAGNADDPLFVTYI